MALFNVPSIKPKGERELSFIGRCTRMLSLVLCIVDEYGQGHVDAQIYVADENDNHLFEGTSKGRCGFPKTLKYNINFDLCLIDVSGVCLFIYS